MCVCVCTCADNIESNVETTAIRVEAGNQQLEKAVRVKVTTCVYVTHF